MKKLRKPPIGRRTALILAVSLTLLAVGAALLGLASKTLFTPLRMAALLHFGTGALLLLALTWSALIGYIKKRLERDAALPAPAAAYEAALAESETAQTEPGANPAETAAEEAPVRESETDGEEKREAKKEKKQRVKAQGPRRLSAPARACFEALARWGNLIGLILLLGAFFAAAYFYIRFSAKEIVLGALGYRELLALVACFALLLIFGKAIKHFAADGKDKSALLSVMDFLRFNLLLLSIGTLIQVTKLFDVTTALRVVEFVMAGYGAVFLLVSLVRGFLRGSCATGVALFIPRPFSKEQDGEEDLVSYLEHSTGITLRSLFGLKVVRKVLPIVICVLAVGFWLSTGLTQVKTYEKGVLYRFGKCEKILEPGFHLTLPYPFDKVELYQTETVREMVVGYEDSDQTNLLWSESHGGTEYKLLLGNGNELVSVNLRVQYKISDLRQYVTCSSQAADILNAKAYAVITDLTVHTTLEDLLAEDRTMLSQTIKERLAAYLEESECGLAVWDIIIESIHPPVEVSTYYQKVVSAELNSGATMQGALGYSLSERNYAESNRNATVKQAEIRQNERIAEAEASVAEFRAMLAAYDVCPDVYYYKYMNALAKSYKGQRLYIIGDDVDAGYLFFGDDVIIYYGNTPD